jgi:hypothetical protein
VNAKALPIISGALLLRVVLEYLVFFAINDSDKKRPGVIAGLALAVFAKDIIMLIVYFIPFFSQTLTWRGSTIKIGKKTKLTLNQDSLLYDKA